MVCVRDFLIKEYRKEKIKMADIEELHEYFVSNIKDKVFFEKKSISGKSYVILYLHDIVTEVESFVETFVQYFPYYVWNEDQLDVLDISSGIKVALEKVSHKCWSSEIVPSRTTSTNGIYGELYLDFYERIVNERKLIIIYASRRSYANNQESKGFDHLGYLINNGKLEIVFGEAKYVSGASSARDNLLVDIRGKADGSEVGHLTKEYIEDFANFAVQKNQQFSEAERLELKALMRELNTNLVNGRKNFLEYIIEQDIKINVVLFAVFKSTYKTTERFESHYDELHKEAENALNSIGITNYSIEVVFIPTESTSMHIKEKIDEFYR